MHETIGIFILIFIVASLIIGSAVRNLLKGTNIPYTVTLLVIGLGLGLVQRTDFFNNYLPAISSTLNLVADIEPHLILFVFLPTLIFESAFCMEVHLFRRMIGQIVMLAIPGLIIAAITTAGLAKIIFPWGWSWPFCLLFGALVSATDPVAVVALLKEVSSRKRLETLLEGESLLNDGTAIVLFGLFYVMVTGKETFDFSLLGVAVDFSWVVLFGLIIGLTVGGLAIFWVGRVFNDPMIEIVVSVAAAYLVFLLAENVFHVSGVVALVALALLFASVGRTRVSPEVAGFLHHFWEMMAHIANTLIFLLVGIVIARRVPLDDPSLWMTLIYLYFGVQLIRAMVVAMLSPLTKSMSIGITREKAIVLVWGGLRGAVSLALALIVAQDSAIEQTAGDQVLFLCAGLVVLTILINGTTMGALLGWLKLDQLPPGKQATLDRASHSIFQEFENLYTCMQGNSFFREADWDEVRERVRSRHVAPAVNSQTCVEASEREQAIAFRRRILEAERRAYWLQFEEGTLGRTATHLLVEAVEHALDGTPLIHPRTDLQSLWSIPKSFKYLKYPIVNKVLIAMMIDRMALGYDVARGFIKAQDEVLQIIDELAPCKEEAETIRVEVINNKRETLAEMEIFRQAFPGIIRELETRAASRVVLNRERALIQGLLASAVLDKPEADRMIADVESRMALLQKKSLRISQPNPAQILLGAEWAKGLKGQTMDKLVAIADQRVYDTGSIIIQQGELGGALGIIFRGVVEITESGAEKEVVLRTVGPGELIGGSLQRSGFYGYSVRAVTPVAVIWLEANKLKPIIEGDKVFAAEIKKLFAGDSKY
ncbi:cation:proton antiporter [Desulfogranum japonicum]|uniref:cation:proton antiporter n=1 Tax=Desulfogranum japonicum TaxID=231447 RepID=UPI000426E544|nr:cation:proton antiporter [Desulfogranum japonicum]